MKILTTSDESKEHCDNWKMHIQFSYGTFMKTECLLGYT